MHPCPPACAPEPGVHVVGQSAPSEAALPPRDSHSPFCLQASVRKKKGKGRPGVCLTPCTHACGPQRRV